METSIGQSIAHEKDIWPVRFVAWRGDTRGIIGALLLAVAFSVNMQITERIDTATTGGLVMWLGVTFHNLWYTSGPLFFGFTGALLVANFNPIIAILTATTPLAPTFFFANMAYTIPFALVMQYVLRKKDYVTFKEFYLGAIIGQLGQSIYFGGIWALLLKLPAWQVVLFMLWNWAMVIPGGFMGYYFCRAIARSGVAE
jgi:hypothetical protein